MSAHGLRYGQQRSTATAPRWNFVQVFPADQWYTGGMFDRPESAPLDAVDRWLDLFDAANELPDGSLPS